MYKNRTSATPTETIDKLKQTCTLVNTVSIILLVVGCITIGVSIICGLFWLRETSVNFVHEIVLVGQAVGIVLLFLSFVALIVHMHLSDKIDAVFIEHRKKKI